MFAIKAATVAGTLLLQTGAGCFSPTILAYDASTVVLKYGPWATVSEIQGKADQLCGEHDKLAQLVADEDELLEPGFRTATFACLGPMSEPLGVAESVR